MKFYLDTLGCRANYSEIEEWKDQIFARGAAIVDEPSQAEIAIINTCTVTNNADRKNRKKILDIQKKNPSIQIYATGCGVKSDGKKQLDGINNLHIIQDKKSFINQLENELLLQIPSEDRIVLDKVIQSGRTRSFVKVQDGCNNFCSYCIIPTVRGREISMDIDNIIATIHRKEKQGFREVVLTGIHLSNWGSDRSDNLTLADLIDIILKKTSIERIRFGSLEPRFFSKKFVQLLNNERVCPHLHLSLQSGNDKILTNMKRHYSAQEYREMTLFLRKHAPVTITTDVIVGFPGETEKDFHETYSYCESLSFMKIHVFPFSSRTGTLAAHLPEKIGQDIKKRRAMQLRTLSDQLEIKTLSKYIGKESNVLFESWKDGYWKGLTPEYICVYIKDLEHNLHLENQIYRVYLNSLLQNTHDIGLEADILFSLHKLENSDKVASSKKLPVIS